MEKIFIKSQYLLIPLALLALYLPSFLKKLSFSYYCLLFSCRFFKVITIKKMDYFIERAAELRKGAEKLFTEKIKLRFLICSMKHHDLNCLNPGSKLSNYIDQSNKISLPDVLPC